MDTETSWPFSWGQPASESSRDTDKLPQITSTLWKQLSEDHIDNLSIPSFTNTPSYRSDDITHNESSTVSISTQPLPPALGTWDKELFSYPLYKSNSQQKNPWDTSLSSTPASQGFTDLLSLGSLGSSKQSSTNYVMFKAGNEENIYPEFLREQETSNVDSGLLLPEQHDPTNQKQHVQPYSNLTNGTWDSDQCIFPLSDPPANVGGSNVHGMSTITPLEQLVTRLRQRQALQDIGNLSYSAASQKMQPPSAFQAPLRNDFASPLKTSLHNSESQYDLYNSQGTTATQPQKQNTDLVALMQELSVLSGTRGAGPSLGGLKCQPSVPATSPTKCCVFCKNNNYHSTFYKSHSLKDERGHCQCPVLRMYVCPLCSATGDGAHTLKYCPRNTVTHGDPISAGLPPGKVTNWREVANRMMARYNAHQ